MIGLPVSTDVGTGTGRYSVLLLKRDADLIGCDLSIKTMARLREKTSRRTWYGRTSAFTFSNESIQCPITSHVMHLVGPWCEALREYQRVLKTGGIYINTRSERPGEPSRDGYVSSGKAAWSQHPSSGHPE
jgi:ubiquinone/menaquinone biosynthesis C-methylase UbiE